MSAQGQGVSCVSLLPSFVQNMLSQDVLDVDVTKYLQENNPLDDDDLAKMHKLFRLAAYRRCSRRVFQILGKKCRRVFPSCIYTSIRNKFASPDGLYTHFKFSSLYEHSLHRYERHLITWGQFFKSLLT